MRVLSLFDGISCARVALDRAEIEVETYYASEIDKHAIAISTKNYPDIVQLGSVVGLTPPENIDLLIGGSPCQDLSIAKKDRKGLDGNRSGLFWEYVRIKDECKPTYFILENVASMPKKDRDTITTTLGVQPVLFNASLVSAQCRKRLFWTNLKFELPEDRGILLKDILQPDAEVDERMVREGKSYCLTASYQGATESNSVERKQRTMVKLAVPKQNEFIQIGYFGAENHCKVGGQALRVYDDSGKSTTSGIGLYKIGHIGNSDAQANRVYDPSGKSCTLSANGGGLGAKTGLYQTTDRIRKLTPIECERLQSLPDNYTEGIAKTNRYKCLGNAFNVNVVSHILSVLHNE
jgi:DNA (cytosine-5)-methyltransferase 3A